MQLQFGQHVRSRDGHDVGKIRHLILDPATSRVKTVVIEKGLLLPDDVEIPAEDITVSPGSGLIANYSAGEIKGMQHFDESRYTTVELQRPGWFMGMPYVGGLFPIGYPLQPYGMAGTPLAAPVVKGEMGVVPPDDDESEQTRDERLDSIISSGDQVVSHDGHVVGEVASITLDDATGKPVSLTVRQGWLFHKDRVLPAEWMESASDGVVYLNLDREKLQLDSNGSAARSEVGTGRMS
jgi:sporulation protein YlmC with PRC-barrel domain